MVWAYNSHLPLRRKIYTHCLPLSNFRSSPLSLPNFRRSPLPLPLPNFRSSPLPLPNFRSSPAVAAELPPLPGRPSAERGRRTLLNTGTRRTV